MDISFHQIRRKDYNKAIDFAVRGMHLDIYFDAKRLTHLYGKILLYAGLVTATQVVAAYDESDNFLGLLTARIDGQKRCFHAILPRLLMGTLFLLRKLFFHGKAGVYEVACKTLLDNWKQENAPDGEMTFLAVDPEKNGQGIGSAMLEEFRRCVGKKLIYLYTDNNCTWQFYEHRGLKRVGEKDIVMDYREAIPLCVMLYALQT